MGNEGVRFDLGGAESPAPVPLAHVTPFALGGLRVEPAAGRVEAGGEQRQLEPLMMQVLIALASAKGATLSRDDLIAGCWQGRIVSDDAINRVISRLRRVLDDLGGGRVKLETVPKVGYRLVMEAPPRGAGPTPEERGGAAPPFLRRPVLLVAGALALSGATALGFAFVPRAGGESLTIGVEPVLSNVSDREASRFASDVTADLARYAGAVSRIDLIDRNLAGHDSPDLLVRVAVERDGPALTARARLVDAGEGSVLWTRDFRQDQGNLAELRVQTAVGLAGVIRCGLERSAGAYDDAPSLRLYFSACDALEAGDWTRAESFARQVVERRPEVAAGLACLAMTILLASRPGSPDEAARVEEARGYAQKALELDPTIGRAYQALSQATGKMDPRTFEILERGLRADPEHRSLHSSYAAQLFNAGYVGASVAPAQRALALDPASLFAHGAMVRRFLAAGRVEEAFAAQAKAERLWPRNPEIVDERIRLLTYWPDRSAALAEFERVMPDAKLPTLRRAELLWKLDPAAIDLTAIEREAETEFAENPSSAWYIAGLMTRLGRHDRALAWLARAPRRGAHNQWSLLFWPEVAPLRRDASFFKAMADLGLVALWVKRGQWPDFCTEPGLRYDCRTEAARAPTRLRT